MSLPERASRGLKHQSRKIWNTAARSAEEILLDPANEKDSIRAVHAVRPGNCSGFDMCAQAFRWNNIELQVLCPIISWLSTNMEILNYIQGRWVTLYPSLDYYHNRDNIVRLLCLLSRRQWGYFAVRTVQSTPPFRS